MRFLTLLKSRLALARFELEAEKRRITALILCALAGFFAVFFGAILASIALAFYFRENAPAIVGAAAAFFLLFGAACFALLPRFLKSTLFADSLSELEKDLALLRDESRK